MKKLLVLSILTIAVFSSGCATWDGLKKDSNKAYNSTKETIHEATE